MSNFTRYINSEVALLCQLDGEGRPNQISVRCPGAAHLITRPGEGGFVGRAPFLQHAALEPLDVGEDARLMRATRPPLRWAVAAPIRLETEIAGAVIAGFATSPRDRARALWATESYAALIGLLLESPGALDGLLAPAGRDGLTGCLNYDATLDQLAREINRSARGGPPLSVCFIDLDGFKRINDRHGHLSGNMVLAQVAEILRDGVRSCDTVGRYGGDEFVAILPQTEGSEAGRLAERLRSLIAAANISSPDHALTASIGVAGWSPGTSAEELLGRADTALLAAKAQRNGASPGAARRGAGDGG